MSSNLKNVLENFDNFFAYEITVYLRTLRSIQIKYFSPESATKANDFLCSCILLAVLLIYFYIETILLKTFMVKNHLLLLVFIS